MRRLTDDGTQPETIGRPRRAASQRSPLPAIRVGIVDGDRLIADMMRRLLEQTGEIAVVGLAESGERGIKLAARQTLDVLVLNHRLPDMSGIEVARHIYTAGRQVAILLMTRYASWSPEGLASQGIDGFISSLGAMPWGFRRSRARFARSRVSGRRSRQPSWRPMPVELPSGSGRCSVSWSRPGPTRRSPRACPSHCAPSKLT